MNKNRYKIVFFFLFILLCFLACTNKEEATTPLAGSPVALHFKLDGGFRRSLSSGGSIANAAEEQVRSIRIMVFNFHTGKVEYNEFDNNGGNDIEFVFSKKVEGLLSGTKSIAVLANEQEGMTSDLENLKNISELKNMTLGDHTTYLPGNTSLYLPSMAEKIAITAAGDQKIGLQLKRALGKVEVRVRKQEDNPNTVQIKSIQILRTPGKTALLESAPLSLDERAALLVDLTKKEFTPIQLVPDADEKALDAYTAYLYEHFGTASTPFTKDEATAVQLDLVLNPDTEHAVEKSYTFPIVNRFDGETPLFEVRRNVLTRMSITVTAKTVILNYTIMPWDEVPAFAKVAGEEDSGIKTFIWDEVGGYIKILGDASGETPIVTNLWDDAGEYNKSLGKDDDGTTGSGTGSGSSGTNDGTSDTTEGWKEEAPQEEDLGDIV